MRKELSKVILLIIVVTITGFTVLFWQIYHQSRIDEAQKADAIVVMGASQWNGEPSPVFQSRLDQAYFLYSKNYASTIILTGGIAKGEIISESSTGKHYLIQKGVKANAIFIEEKGHTSWQSLKEVALIANHYGLRSIILVSDGFHMMRLKKMTHDLGLTAFSSPALESPIAKNKIVELKYVMRECIVFILYLLFKI
jgi:uncharacterized SAM-binding protein YcdF (DUF218 family)